MIQHPRRAVQRDHHADEQKGRRHNDERIFVREADVEDGGGKLQCRGVEGVGEPVGYEGVDGPFPVGETDRVEVCKWGGPSLGAAGLGGGVGGGDVEGVEGGEGRVPLLLHLLAPTAPEKTEGTCSTRHSGRWIFDRRRNRLAVAIAIFCSWSLRAGGLRRRKGLHPWEEKWPWWTRSVV